MTQMYKGGQTPIAHARTLKHRAEDLIRIAHPDFRPALIEEYERRFMCKYEDTL